MQHTIILALFLQLSVGALGTNCAAGYKHKATLTGLTCSTAATDAAACNSNCCEEDTTTCGGALAKVNSLACPWDSYHATDDAWKNTKAFTAEPSLTVAGSVTAADVAAATTTWQTKCCTRKAACASGTCPNGMKKKANVDAVKCDTDVASCREYSLSGAGLPVATCCESNTATCGGYYLTHAAAGTTGANANCAAGTYAPTATTATAMKHEAWLGLATNNAGNLLATYRADCCMSQATCASTMYSCPAGQKRETTNAAYDTTVCFPEATDATGCAATAQCCQIDTAKCRGYTPACPANTYYPDDDTWKNVAASTQNEANSHCCTAMATCKDATCPSGWKKRDAMDNIVCTGNAASCTASGSTTLASCCEKDVTKCGGLSGIGCAYGFYDERNHWILTGDVDKQTSKATQDAWNNKPATDATKNTACCTAKAVCTGAAIGTTTPAPAAATTTPATAIRRYSEHKVAVQEGSDHPWSANMVWLGVGGLIGMSVLMAVQGLRSRMPMASAETDVTQADAREVGDMLLDNASLE